MSTDKPPVVIKKYANRRLYDTGSSAYVTLEDLASMVKSGEDFVVFDAKSGEDITRSVLGQIIFEQESKTGQSLLPITFLRQLIRFYGDGMQLLVPSYLEFSLTKLAQQRQGFSHLFDGEAITNATRPVFAQIEEQTRQNMAMFRQALNLFNPFVRADELPCATGAATGAPGDAAESAPALARGKGAGAAPAEGAEPGRGAEQEYEDVRRQLEELQRRVAKMAPKGDTPA